MWFYKLSGKEFGPVSKDELKFLLQNGTVPRDSLVREEESAQWESASAAGLIVRKATGPAKERKSVAPAAPFAQDLRERPKARIADESQQPSVPVETTGPKLPPALKSDSDRENRGPIIAAVVAGVALLLLLLLLFYNRTENQGMADSGDGSGAQEQGDAQSSGASDSQGESEASGETEASAPASDATSGTSTTASEATDSAASSTSDPSTAQTSGDESDVSSDSPAGSEVEMASDSDTGLAIGDGDDSRFSIAAPGETSFFGLKGSGRRFTYIVDCSGSMSGAPLARATEELLKSLDRFPKHVEFQIIFFDDFAYTYPQSGFASISDDLKPDVERFVASVRGGGGTNVKIALEAAFRSRTKPDTVFLLTDGQFDQDTPDYAQRLNSGRKSRINTVAFISNAGELLLKEIANKNRGDYRFVP
jgi:hypothetical protein